MRILTQNILRCNVKSCVDAAPWLKLIVDKSEINESEFLAKNVSLNQNGPNNSH